MHPLHPFPNFHVNNESSHAPSSFLLLFQTPSLLLLSSQAPSSFLLFQALFLFIMKFNCSILLHYRHRCLSTQLFLYRQFEGFLFNFDIFATIKFTMSQVMFFLPFWFFFVFSFLFLQVLSRILFCFVASFCVLDLFCSAPILLFPLSTYSIMLQFSYNLTCYSFNNLCSNLSLNFNYFCFSFFWIQV